LTRDKQAVQAVGHAGDLTGEVVVEPDDDFQVGQGVVVHVDPAQGVRHGPGGLGDDVGVAAPEPEVTSISCAIRPIALLSLAGSRVGRGG